MAKRGVPIIEKLGVGETASGLAQFVEKSDGTVQIKTNSGVQDIVHAANINTVLAAAGGAGWEKAQSTAPNYAITKPASGAGLDLHIEFGGSLAALTSIAWPVPASGVDQLRIRNFSGQSQNFTAGAGWQIVTADGNPVTSGSYSIPDDRAIEITLDPHGFAQVVPWGGEVSEATFNTHTANVSNIHAVTKAQVGLGSVDNTADISKPVSTAQQAAFDLKEPKVTGKGLSANDYTTTEKNKLAGVATSATANDTDANLKARANHTGTQAQSTVDNLTTDLAGKSPTAHTHTGTYEPSNSNIQSHVTSAHAPSNAEMNISPDWNAASGDAQILNKPTIPALSSTTPVMDGTAAVGTGTTSARADHVHGSDTSKAGTAYVDTELTAKQKTLDAIARRWTPNQDLVTGMQVMFRPEELPTTGTVTAWNDVSGNARNLSQGGTSAPSVSGVLLNGLPVVQFATATDRLTTAAIPALHGVDSTMFVVFEHPAAAVSAELIGQSDGNSRCAYISPKWSDNNLYVDYGNAAGSRISLANSPFVGDEVFHILSARRSGTTSGEVWRNGTSVVVDNTLDTPAAFAANAPFLVGSAGGVGNESFAGKVAEIIIYNTALTAAEREQIEGYLGHKYGLQANLPAGHTYRNVVPTVNYHIHPGASVKVTRSTVQSLASTGTIISWDTVDHEVGATTLWDVANPTRLTAPVTGTYLIVADIAAESDSIGQITFMKNGTAVHNGTAPRFWTGSGSTSALVRLAVGDYIECKVYPATTVNSIVAAERHYLAMVFVSL